MCSNSGYCNHKFTYLVILLIVSKVLIFIECLTCFLYACIFSFTLMIITITCTMLWCANKIVHNESKNHINYWIVSGVHGYIGLCFGCFQGINLVFPIRAGIKKPRNYFKVFTNALLCMAGMYISVQIVVYKVNFSL